MKKGNEGKIIFFSAAILLMAGAILFSRLNPTEYFNPNSEDVTYVRAKVTAVSSEELEENYEGVKKGVQELQVEVLSGRYKNEIIAVTNQLSASHSIYTVAGQRIILCIDQAEEDYYLATVYNYDRLLPALLMVGAFLAVLVLLGGETGLRSAFGLLFTFVMLIFVLIPLISMGKNAVLSSVFVILIITVISLISLLGFHKKALVSILGTGLGIVFCCILFFLAGHLLHVNGYLIEEVDTLLVVSKSIDIKIKDMLFAGVLIASLGAVMDVSVSVSSSILELHQMNPEKGCRELFYAGLRIGKDIIGTMSNTLILAFTGTFFVTLILFRIYQVSAVQFMNMDTIAIEIAQALSSTMALALTVPISAYAAAWIYSREKQ